MATRFVVQLKLLFRKSATEPDSAAGCGPDSACDWCLRQEIESHVKRIEASTFVQDFGDAISDARWLEGFAVEFTVGAESAEALEYSLKYRSLEDGEYEACFDNGWTIKCGAREIGLVNYNRNNISILPA